MTASKIVAAAASSAGGATLDIDDVFSTYLYTGNSSTQTITNNIDLSGEGGLVWTKTRSVADNHRLTDTARGAGKGLDASNTYAEWTANPSAGIPSGVSSFNSNGFVSDLSHSFFNNEDVVSWTFRKAPKFFQCITYSGNSTAGRTISHNLGCAVGQVWVKRTNTSNNWICWHRGIANNKYLQINNTSPAYSDGGIFWNNTTPSSTTVTLGSDSGVNATGSTYVMYVFAHNNNDGGFGPDSDQDIIKCGSYNTDGNGDATVNLGFEPQFVLVKCSTATSNWYLLDTIRGMYHDNPVENARLYADTSGAESSTGGTSGIVPTSTGFFHDGYIAASQTFIFMALRRGSLNVPDDATKVFAIDAAQANVVGQPAFESNFVTDHMIAKVPGSSGDWLSNSRLVGTKYMSTNTTAAELNSNSMLWDYNNGVWERGSGGSYTAWMWKRAPGFFDVVTWEGASGTLNSVKHNLGVKPDLVILKYRGTSDSWYVYNSATTGGQLMTLNTNGGIINSTDYMASTTDTDLNVTGLVSNPYSKPIALLFATCPGVSKVGTFSTSSSDLIVDCGFSAGARFVLLKRTTSGSANWDNWFIFDVGRGISTGSDQFLELNTTDAAATDGNNIEPHASGFKVKNGGGLNFAGGATILFYAIA
mgnify:FL=1